MHEDVLNISDADFEEKILNSNVPVLVDFWAPWCGPCVALSSTIDAIAEEYKGKVVVAKMNVDENANIPAQYGVRSIPFVVMIKNGDVCDTMIGAQPKAKIVEMVEKTLS